MKRAFIALLIALVWASPSYAQLENWSTFSDENNSASPLGAPEGMAPSGVNNTMRENMAQVRRLAEQSISGMFSAVTGESVIGTFRITPFIAPTTGAGTNVPLGAIYWFQSATDTAVGAITLQVSGYAARQINFRGTAISGADIKVGDWIGVIYDGSQFEMINTPRTFLGAGK